MVRDVFEKAAKQGDIFRVSIWHAESRFNKAKGINIGADNAKVEVL